MEGAGPDPSSTDNIKRDFPGNEDHIQRLGQVFKDASNQRMKLIQEIESVCENFQTDQVYLTEWDDRRGRPRCVTFDCTPITDLWLPPATPGHGSELEAKLKTYSREYCKVRTIVQNHLSLALGALAEYEEYINEWKGNDQNVLKRLDQISRLDTSARSVSDFTVTAEIVRGKYRGAIAYMDSASSTRSKLLSSALGSLYDALEANGLVEVRRREFNEKMGRWVDARRELVALVCDLRKELEAEEATHGDSGGDE
ncbi:unnamed protein product [Parascedosporium putredinis]|uniref:Uncharacterized protein n=1 Tax=Parascedosporium putredinis TaxID=1442378 RepID=A0A9P1GZN9_9PEZI|nr:unnamed protein product [Parascedosporium putredinis]CAI7991968.1 unnamed protein product [Parascedosporium putredinis]